MVDKKSSLVVASMFAMISFLAVFYVSSCKKTNKDYTRCKNITCLNGGYCNHNDTGNLKLDTCVCPTGYEGVNCETRSVDKYFGYWTLNQKIVGSDSSMYIGKDTIYTAILRQTATPTTFFIANFNNNEYYNDIICTLDTTSTDHFRIDTISAFQMIYYSYQILDGGTGYINKTHDTINATFRTRHRNYTSNWEVDTLSVLMTFQHQ